MAGFGGFKPVVFRPVVWQPELKVSTAFKATDISNVDTYVDTPVTPGELLEEMQFGHVVLKKDEK